MYKVKGTYLTESALRKTFNGGAITVFNGVTAPIKVYVGKDGGGKLFMNSPSGVMVKGFPIHILLNGLGVGLPKG